MHPARKFIRRFGFDVHRFNPYSSEEYRLNHLLQKHGVNVVLDVGANCGQYAMMLRSSGYRGRIVSFEPQAELHSQLVAASRNDPDWIAAERMALGSARSTMTMNLAGNKTASSLLPMLDSHSDAARGVVYVGTETVPVAPLDDIAPAYIAESDQTFLKLDVQGFESAVLDGAPSVLGRAVGLQLEMSIVPLYEGQPSFEDLYRRASACGFVLWTILQGFCDMSSGRSFQCDCVFFRD